jgi:predicted metal-dependent phosphoesterase TrpH
VGGWATACETAFWSTGTFARCYETNRRASIDDVVDADPVAACVREIMATRSAWTGSATDLLRAGADLTDDGIWRGNAGWPQNPRALAGRLRRAQTFLRAVGIDIAFQS